MKSSLLSLTTATVVSACLSLGWSSAVLAQSAEAPNPAVQPAVVPTSPPAIAPVAASTLPANAQPPAVSEAFSPGNEPVTQPSAQVEVQATATAPEAAPVAQAEVVGACFTPPSGASPSEVEAFLADPQQLLTVQVASPFILSNRVRSIAGSDVRTIDPLIGLSRTADVDKAAAIGAGLGRAAFGCASVNPAYAALIQARVAELGAVRLMTAFVAASNDLRVAALASGAGASGGVAAAGLTGTGDAGPFSAGLGGDETVPTTVSEYNVQGRRIIVIDNDDNDGDGCDSSVSPSCAN